MEFEKSIILPDNEGDALRLIRDKSFDLENEVRDEYITKMKTAPYQPKMLTIVMRYDCVYSCDQCFFYGNPKNNVILPDEAIDKALYFASKNGMNIVQLTGGEPMMDPEKVFRNLKKIKDYDLAAVLQSSYLGNTKDEIEDNARIIGDLGVETFATSLSMYHERTKPSTLNESYVDYLLTMIDAITENGMNVELKNTWDVDIGENESLDQSREFAHKLLKSGAKFFGEPYGPRIFLFGMNGQKIKLYDSSIISVGNARAKGLISQKPSKWEENLYNCPIFYEHHHDGGMLTVYPDGKVARCCAAEKNADFGFGNILTDPLDKIMENIRRSEYVRPDMDYILKEGHKMLKEEYPGLLPKEGASQACEICSPIVSHKKTRYRLYERLKKPGLFLPYNQIKNP